MTLGAEGQVLQGDKYTGLDERIYEASISIIDGAIKKSEDVGGRYHKFER
jgi:hypothetical protein